MYRVVCYTLPDGDTAGSRAYFGKHTVFEHRDDAEAERRDCQEYSDANGFGDRFGVREI